MTAQWGNTDNASNSVFWGVAMTLKVHANTLTQTQFYQNNTPNAYVNNMTWGQFGVSPNELKVTKGPIVNVQITYAGSGYTANAVISFANTNSYVGNAVANAVANSTGKIYSAAFTNNGNNYVGANPSITIAAPAAPTFNANTAVSNSTQGNAIAISSSSYYVAGDPINYIVSPGNTAIGGLTANTLYYVYSANATSVVLTNTLGGAQIALTKGFTETGHALQGATATGIAINGGGRNKGVTSSGWVIRKVGTGGRAGRVQYETIVAMGSLPDNASDNWVLPDA